MKKFRVKLNMTCEGTGRIQERFTNWRFSRLLCYIDALNFLVENRLEAEFLTSWEVESK